MTDKESQRLERLITAAVTAAVLAWGTVHRVEDKAQVEKLEAENLQAWEGFREFIFDTAKCQCPEDQ